MSKFLCEIQTAKKKSTERERKKKYYIFTRARERSDHGWEISRLIQYHSFLPLLLEIPWESFSSLWGPCVVISHVCDCHFPCIFSHLSHQQSDASSPVKPTLPCNNVAFDILLSSASLHPPSFNYYYFFSFISRPFCLLLPPS